MSTKKPKKPRCPKCGSTDVQLLRMRWKKQKVECLNFNCERDSRGRGGK